jgi:hypothetical protein
MAIDWRTDSIFRRFTSALPHLKARSIQDVVSLKHRDRVANYSEYSDFVDDYLIRRLKLDVEMIDLRGRAWIVKDKSGNCVILVEHETGLEILYVAGSIASLVTLIPMISSGWKKLRGRFSHHHFDNPDDGVEIRRFNQRKVLVEDKTPSVEVYVLNTAFHDHALLKNKVEELEAEVNKLKKKQLPKKKSLMPKPKRKKKK